MMNNSKTMETLSTRTLFAALTLITLLMVLGSAAHAADIICDTLGDYPEAGLCDAYCTAMDCDLINDEDPLSSPQASAAACKNVAATFHSFLLGIQRRDVVVDEAVTDLDEYYCRVSGEDSCPPNC